MTTSPYPARRPGRQDDFCRRRDAVRGGRAPPAMAGHRLRRQSVVRGDRTPSRVSRRFLLTALRCLGRRHDFRGDGASSRETRQLPQSRHAVAGDVAISPDGAMPSAAMARFRGRRLAIGRSRAVSPHPERHRGRHGDFLRRRCAVCGDRTTSAETPRRCGRHGDFRRDSVPSRETGRFPVAARKLPRITADSGRRRPRNLFHKPGGAAPSAGCRRCWRSC